MDPLDEHAANQLATEALTPWGRAKDAAAKLDQIVKSWSSLAAAGAVRVPVNERALIVAALDSEQLASHQDRPQGRQHRSTGRPPRARVHR